ncbi:DUF2269 domain-containing protein [Jannaschia sp.]|nr:DUF2269 domain-containing protein [Jannaschia sp.]
MSYDLILFAHLIGATVLMGTGAGIAFFMLMSHRSGDLTLIAHVAGIVIVADYAFTATAAVAQPITGLTLAVMGGWPLTTGWVAWSLTLYVFIGALWLPVVWMQTRMRSLAVAARDADAPLPQAYHRLFRTWFAFGVPAFAAILAILWLMVTKPG